MAGRRVIQCVGPSYPMPDRKSAVQRSVNLYLREVEGLGEDKQLVLDSAPGLEVYLDLGGGGGGLVNGPQILFLDTFTGMAGTTLDQHMPDVGGPWRAFTTPWFGPIDLSRLWLDGGGTMTADGYFGSSEAMATPAASTPTGDHTIEIDFVLNGSGGPYCGFCATEGGAGYVMNWFVHEESGFEIDFYRQYDNGAADDMGLFNVPYVAGSHTLRIEVTGTMRLILLDGIQLTSFEDPIIPNYGAFYLAPQDSANILWSRVQIQRSAS
jgi:hypothetical protein